MDAHSTHLCEDQMGRVHEIAQGLGGEQGGPMVPLLVSLGEHAVLQAANAILEDIERLLTLLGEVHVTCVPGRVGAVHQILQDALWAHARIRIHHGKTQIWN